VTYAIRALAQQLDVDKDGRLPDLAWIERSTREPEPFWDDLGAALGAQQGPRLRSRVGDRYDLYHDLVTRHLGAPDRPALRWYERMRGFQDLSYGELHARAGRKAGEWAAQEVEAGDLLAVVLHPGPAWLVALLAALRMGLVVSWLPPLGDLFLARRLKKLDPKHIATDPSYLSLLEGHEKALLQDSAFAPAYPDRAHSYAPGEPCGMLFSPLYDPPSAPRPLLADAAFLAAARDGLFAHRIGPGHLLAAPGFHPLQHQPALVFTALLAGATWLEIPEGEVVADPGLFTRFPLQSLGVSVPVRDALLASNPGKLSSVAHWFRNVEEPLDTEAFPRFVEELGLSKTPASSLLVDATLGGCALQSVRRRAADWRLLPAPGQPYALYDVVSRKEAAGAHGLFAPKPEAKPTEVGHAMVSRNGPELAYGGTATPRRDGRHYPGDEVVAAVSELPFCAGAFVIHVAAGGMTGGYLFTLCVFTGAETPEETEKKRGERDDAIEREILRRLGREFLPDRSEYFPLYPRLEKGAVDLVWCETQYRMGLLARKSLEPMFQKLTALRRRCVIETEKRS
jgi:AMP-binding enzyme